VTESENKLREICDYIRKCVDSREKELVKDLNQCRTDGNEYIVSRRSQLASLKTKLSNDADFERDLNEFTAGLAVQDSLKDERLFCDTTLVAKPLLAMGKVTAVVKPSPSSSKPAPVHVTEKPAAPQTVSNGAPSVPKVTPSHATPVNKQAAPKKENSTSVVKNGGFLMSSEGISTDALVAMQEQLKADLRERGVDMSVVEDMNNGGFSAPRRRPNGKENNTNNSKSKVAGGRATRTGVKA